MWDAEHEEGIQPGGHEEGVGGGAPSLACSGYAVLRSVLRPGGSDLYLPPGRCTPPNAGTTLFHMPSLYVVDGATGDAQLTLILHVSEDRKPLTISPMCGPCPLIRSPLSRLYPFRRVVTFLLLNRGAFCAISAFSPCLPPPLAL